MSVVDNFGFALLVINLLYNVLSIFFILNCMFVWIEGRGLTEGYLVMNSCVYDIIIRNALVAQLD